MGKSRKMLMSQIEEEPEMKKPRTGPLTADLSTEEGEIMRTNHNSGCVVASGTYISKVESRSMHFIKHRIQEDDKLSMGYTELYYLYPAFKEALLRILIKIEEALTCENDPVRIILVHGVPRTGTSSLAKCLAYFLALSTGGKEAIHLLKLRHSVRVNDRVVTNYITDACNNKYLIVDQVNTHTLERAEIWSCVRNRLTCGKNRMPLVMFTSGHYTPSEEWQNMQKSGLLCYKIITMQVDDAVVNKLRESRTLTDDAISNDALLKVTTSFSRMIKCLDHLEYDNPDAGEEDLRKSLYPGADVNLIREGVAVHFLFLVWQEFLLNELPPLEDLTDDDLKLEPYDVHYLGYLIS